MMKTYYMLTKPGIIMGNIVTTAAGFALASQGHFDITLFLFTLIGLGFIIASAGVFNNYIDRHMDAKMERTKNRAIPSGLVSHQNALIYASVLCVIGVGVLSYTNLLTVGVALAGFFVYLVLYAFMKYRSFYGTLIGSIAGAVPPVVGYCAVSDRLDLAALLLFLIVVLWQMPHFFAIAIYRIDDYAAASIPVLPIEKGIYITKIHMLLYIIVFMMTALLLTVAGYTGYIYAFAVFGLSLGWLGFCLSGFTVQNDKRWARQMFVYSLVVIMGLCVAIPFDINGS
ncbi:MAG TPA: heme o synthase [Parachlamydiaceae bacterium]|nr:heme o synthase [Parachlamydiaceae bacterium]